MIDALRIANLQTILWTILWKATFGKVALSENVKLPLATFAVNLLKYCPRYARCIYMGQGNYEHL